MDRPTRKPLALRAVNDALAVPDGGLQLAKRDKSYNGRGSWFFPGRGACGTYSGDSDYVGFERHSRRGVADGSIRPCFAFVDGGAQL